MKKKKADWFLIGMVIAVILAWLFPEPGADGGWLHPELITNGGVALIFFLHGVGISFPAMRAGMMQWKLHLLIQSCVFLLFPIVGTAIYFSTANQLPVDLRIGILYLCALPSTVSTSVALTAIAKGNVPAAVFNATISSLLGILFTPLWMSIAADTSAASGSMGSVMLNLCMWLVLPLVVGQLSRPWLGDWVKRHKPFVSTVDRTTILLLVYTSFCDSFVMEVWTKNGLLPVMVTFPLSVALFYSIFWSVSGICSTLHLSREDKITAVLCGSKKSLATGIPMAQLMFGSHPGLGLILLPIMIYHPLQLIICGVLANRWGTEATPPQPAESTPANA
ncbi:bile acid:sodium symporter family protein [Planctomicrobium sp. SH527]|uniref:bile acid:sodium symporter family protein n=1 Tax=Planctomicrobium sp. SH527 TaxID=3448123 RepID=UPI003F5AEC79